MPLKHFTETFLVVVLGAVVALTGLLVSTLPPLPQGALPWAVLFVLSMIYPLSLHSLFQKRRADNFFRKLHWFPAGILLVWLLLQGIAIGSTLQVAQMTFYTWGWALGAVLVGFVLIVMFCLKVIRRRVPRLSFLALILVPFTTLAIASEQGNNWEQELAAVLWDYNFWTVSDSGLIAQWVGETGSQSGKNLEASSDPSEEQWRERLRMQEEREKRIAERMNGKSSSNASSISSAGNSSSESSEAIAMASVSSMPTRLPNSGFGWSAIAVLLLAGYCCVLQLRAENRA